MISVAGIFGVAAAAAVIELDAVAVGQLMVSRPLVLGPILGAFLGEPAMGASLGFLFELFNIGDLPVGGNVPLNSTVAVSSALLLTLGPTPVAMELALPTGLAVGWGHARAEGALRRRRSRLNLLVERRLAQGKDTDLGRLAAAELFKQAAMTFAILGLALLCRAPLRWLWAAAPQALSTGLRLGFAASPWLALWALTRSFRVIS